MQGKIKSLKDGAYQYCESDKLGQGAFAKVYKGTITKNQRTVAIRLLPLTLIDEYGDKIKQIITDEVSVLRELSRSDEPDVIFTTKIYDCFMTGNNVVMILQYCPQGNLEDVLKNGPLQESQALMILYQLARGLEFIAKENVVHRDIKTDNIFIKKVGDKMVFKIGDFGFAVKKQLNSDVVGTPIYMSPELFKEQSYGSEVDVWAFGLMAHYCLFKEHYFLAQSQPKVKKKVLYTKYELKKEQLAKVSHSMADFLTRCLKANKNERLNAKNISSHPVFDPVRQQVEQSVKIIESILSVQESQLSKSTVKGKVMNQIVKYSFLSNLSLTFSKINPFNYASLYILKHNLGELSLLKNNIQNKINFVSSPEWDSFCNTEHYPKAIALVQSLLSKCEKNFQFCFNQIIPVVRTNHGEAVVSGIIQNLGKGPYDQINPNIISYELQNFWFPWISKNNSNEMRLVALEMIASYHVYKNKPFCFDFVEYEMQKSERTFEENIEILEKSFKSAN